MTDKNPMPATDSARDLRNLVGDDATADFQTDPKFVDGNPTTDASSENFAAMRDTDDEEESDDEIEDEEDDEEYDEDEEDEDDEDEDEEAEYDDEEEEDEEDDEEDEDDDDDEDDEDEVGSSDPTRFILKRAA